MDKITSLSQAIRVGSLSTKQCRGQLYKVEQREEYTCAIGAAAYALGLLDGYTPLVGEAVNIEAHLCKRFDLLKRNLIGLPHRNKLGLDMLTVTEAIMTLNDYSRWSREKIADWLEAQGL